jgi:lipid-A-disaccharide synthase
MKKNILIIAGEPSGDIRGAELVRQLKRGMPGTDLWGIGGDEMAAEGVELVEHIRDLSMVGAAEIITKLPDIHRQYKNLTVNIGSRKPDLAILIDYPGFNLKVAGYLHRAGVPVIYYIIPQVWAWGAWRIKKLKKYVSKALVLFPFEETLLKRHGIDCDFVGHPIVDAFIDTPPVTPDNKGKLVISLLPGSRKHEINSVFPVMLEAAEKITTSRKDVKFLVAESPNIEKSLYDRYTAPHKDLALERLRNDTRGALARADLAIVTSGTATLEAAMMEKPMIIVYKASLITYMFYLILSRVPFLGLANILAGREIVPELLQGKLDPETLSRALLDIAEDPDRMRKTAEELKKVRLSLGERGAAERAARAVKAFAEKL